MEEDLRLDLKGDIAVDTNSVGGKIPPHLKILK